MNLKTGLISPQYHLIFDDEFSTVTYLSSICPPPNWLHLVKHCTERSTDDQQKLSHRWLYPHDTDGASNTPCEISGEPTSEPNATSNKSISESSASHNLNSIATATSQPQTPPITDAIKPSASSLHKSAGEDSNDISPFVQLETLGLRRSERIKALPKSTKPYGLLVLAMSAIAQTANIAHDLTTKCFQTRLIHYNDYV